MPPSGQSASSYGISIACNTTQVAGIPRPRKFLLPLYPECCTPPPATSPTAEATNGGRYNLNWTEEATLAFEASKQALANASFLTYTKPDALTSIVCNTSDSTVGAVLQPEIRGQWCPITYFSKQLQSAQKKVQHYWQFVVITDHQPLT